MATPPNIEPALPRALAVLPIYQPLGISTHEEHHSKRIPEALGKPPLHAALVPSAGHTVHIHAVERRTQAGEDGRYKGSRAMRSVFRMLQARMQDEETGRGDEKGGHGPIEALFERVVVEPDVNGGDETR